VGECSSPGARRADVSGVDAWDASCRGFGIAKNLKMRQLHTRQGCHQADVGLGKSGKNVARAAAEGRFPMRWARIALGDARRFY
jgi:hypothetical protein